MVAYLSEMQSTITNLNKLQLVTIILGKAAANEQLKEELEGIIGGLTEYLNNVKQQATRQREDYDDLQREKDTLMEQLHQLEAEKSMMRYEVEEREKLQKRIDDLEKSLGEAQTLNESLRDTQNELSQRPDPEIEAKMKAALKEADKLRLALEEEQRKAQVLIKMFKNYGNDYVGLFRERQQKDVICFKYAVSCRK
uniref:Centriolin-like n=1 Tax=Saccoglossus kowalevskii TaxID=10224 RepID=A0ABM0M5I6_SACKO|nr:PREDICTED: centriolin-like [Saccoglossus kowalevskii]